MTDRQLLESISLQLGSLSGEFIAFKEDSSKRFDGLEKQMGRVEEKVDRLEENVCRLEKKIVLLEEKTNFLQKQIDALSNIVYRNYRGIKLVNANQAEVFATIGRQQVPGTKLRRKLARELLRAS